jgi:hypothetical protein
VHLLVRPQPQRAGAGVAWADPWARPRWTQVLGRSVAIQQEQSIFDDLSGVQDANERLAAVDSLVAALLPVVTRASPTDREELRAALARPGSGGPTGESIEALLRNALSAAAHVAGKRPIGVESIALPEPDAFAAQADGRPLAEVTLAGAGLFRFAGFLDERLRRHDFSVGYDSALQWLVGGGLTRHGLTRAQSETMIAAVRGRRPAQVPRTREGLTLRGRWAAGWLLARMGLVALHDLVAGPRGADDVRRGSGRRGAVRARRP